MGSLTPGIKIWVDDVRPMPSEGFTHHCWRVDNTIWFIEHNWNNIVYISLDHDAGRYAQYGGDYIKILDWIEEYCYTHNISKPPFKITLHTQNAVGAQNMKRIIDKWKNL